MVSSMHRQKEHFGLHGQFLLAMFSAANTLLCSTNHAKNLELTSEAVVQMTGTGKLVIAPRN
jgi:hypothetical protein